MKICNFCNIEKPLEFFEFRKDNNKYRNKCKHCCSKYGRLIDFQNNLRICTSCRELKLFSEFKKRGYKCKSCITNIKIKNHKKCIENFKNRHPDYGKIRYQKLTEDQRKRYNIRKRELYHKNIEKQRLKSKLYRLKNKDKIKERRNNKNKILRKTDQSFKLRENISRRIRQELKRNGSKKTNSFIKYIHYSINELKEHLESQFEAWMNWDNYGIYNAKSWSDENLSTWTWQIDHIIPRYKLPFSSMEDENFKKCWSLSNLRPLSAKQNYLDGMTKKR